MSSHTPPEFFIDRSMGMGVVATLRREGEIAHAHDDYLPQDTPDTDWLSFVGGKGWVVISKDRRIRHNRLEREALMNAGVAAFFLTSGQLTGHEMAKIVLSALPNIKRTLKNEPRPFIAVIHRTGEVRVVRG